MPFETARLAVRRFVLDDAAFILALVNEPGWLAHIGDRGVRTLADAEGYLRDGPLASYAIHGFGLYHVALRATGAAVGMCGILRRDGLDAPDLGYALLGSHAGLGYATEAARATLAHARRDLGLTRVLAITSPENAASQRVLEKVGMQREGMVQAGGGGPSVLFGIDLGGADEAQGPR